MEHMLHQKATDVQIKYIIMKKLFIINLMLPMFLIGFYSCSGQNGEPENVIKSFNTNFLLLDSFQIDKMNPFIELHDSHKNNVEFTKQMTYLFELRHLLDSIEPGGYNILSYNKMDSYPKFKKLKLYQKLNYLKKENVYYGIKSDESESAYIYIVENGKIISFFPYIHIGADSIQPYMLNKKVDNEYLKMLNDYLGL